MSTALKQLVVIGAVLAIILVFIIQFRPGTNVQTSGGPQCIAEVGGQCIQEADYIAAYRLMAPPNASGDDIKAMRLPRVVVDGLIERWLLMQDAERLGLSVSDDELTRQLADGHARVSLPAAYEDFFSMRLGLLPQPDGPARALPVRDPRSNKFDVKRYERAVREVTSKTPKDFRDFQRAELLAARMRSLVRSRVRVSEAEGRDQFVREQSRATVKYAKLERGWYARWIVDVTDDAVAEWAQEHDKELGESWEARKEGFLPECRVARHILVKVDPMASDQEAEQKKARETLAAARKRLDEGEKFADLARELTDDPTSRSLGGSLGCVGKGRRSKPFEDALFALDVGKVSEIVEDSDGLHIIRLDKIAKDADAEKLGKRQVARELLLKQESERLATEGAKQILAAVQGGKPLDEAVRAHVDSMLAIAKTEEPGAAAKPAAEPPEGGPDSGEEEPDGEEPAEPQTAATDRMRPKVESSIPFTVKGPPFAGLQDPTAAARTIFALEKAGDVPKDLLKLVNGYAVVQLVEKTVPTDEQWNDKRGEYLDALRRDKQRDALARYVASLRERLAKDVKYAAKLTEEADGEKKQEQK